MRLPGMGLSSSVNAAKHFEVNRLLRLILAFVSLGGTISPSSGQTEPRTNKRGEDTALSFQQFVSPPADSKPFMRWWWNGNRVTKSEISRQLDVLAAAGVGGVEINPIAMPEGISDAQTKPLDWLSSEWIDMLHYAAAEAKDRGMLVDLLVGTGWPFGGEFLTDDQVIERAIVHRIPCEGGNRFHETANTLYDRALDAIPRPQKTPADHYEVLFVRVVPTPIGSIADQVDLTAQFKAAGNSLEYTVPDGEYELVYGILQKGYRKVVHGAPGGAGNVMDHYRTDVTQAYLGRLDRISRETGVPLSALIRALFSDSIELDGANWTSALPDRFFAEYGYRLKPWLPFVFYDLHRGYADGNYSGAFADELARVRYDYNRLLVRTFLKNFVRVFQQYSEDNGVLSRYQPYGFPWLLGILEGGMAVDIPESNNWLFASNMDTDEWNWHHRHGYMVWNLYAASAGHLTGKRIVSVEAMTNTKGVFKASLADIKQADDMNFITGMNHSVLHGFNYSPLYAGFPGWVRYGTFFSEKNTWWPYFPKWASYNARLSYVFQHARPVKQIAIVTPLHDLWAKRGLMRADFHTEPWYAHRLWEAISQAGSSCDYITANIIKHGTVGDGQLQYGPMAYSVVLLASVSSVDPEVAQKLAEFVKSGGTLITVDSVPNRSLSMKDRADGDQRVSRTFSELAERYPTNFYRMSAPLEEHNMLPWVGRMLTALWDQRKDGHDVRIESPNRNLFQVHATAGNEEIYFFTNTNRTETVGSHMAFPVGEKVPWIWDPVSGIREPYTNGKSNAELYIQLQPLQSLLLVFQPRQSAGTVEYAVKDEVRHVTQTIDTPWEMTFEHIDGTTFTRHASGLQEFGTSEDSLLNSFAGTVRYRTTFQSDGAGEFLRINDIHNGVVEVFLNGAKIGERWYGVPLFEIGDQLVHGENTLEIKYTTVLSNYMMELEAPGIKMWTQNYKKMPSGISGRIDVLSARR